MNGGVLITTDGLTPDPNFPPTPFFVINNVYKQLVSHCISGSSQIGATAVMLIVVMLLTPHARRKNFIFAVNLVTLLCNLVRVTTYTMYFLAGFSTPRGLLTRTRVDAGTGAYVNSTLSCAFNALTVYLIEASLFWQTYKVISPAIKQRNRVMIISASSVAVTAPLITSTLLLGTTLDALWNGKINDSRFQIAETFAFAISICYFSLMFVVKLLSVIRFRRKIGNDKFGAMQVICLMFCQSMIVPAVLLVLQLIYPATLLSTLTITIVAMSLPLTAIWANSVENDRRNGQDKAALNAKNIPNGFGASGARKPQQKTWLGTAASALGQPSKSLFSTRENRNKTNSNNSYGNDIEKGSFSSRNNDSTPYIEAKLNFSALDANFTNSSQLSTARARSSWDLPAHAPQESKLRGDYSENGRKFDDSYTSHTLISAEGGFSPSKLHTASEKQLSTPETPSRSGTVVRKQHPHAIAAAEPLGSSLASYPNQSGESVATTASNTMIESRTVSSEKQGSWRLT